MTNFSDSFRMRLAAGMIAVAALLYFFIIQIAKQDGSFNEEDTASIRVEPLQPSLPDFSASQTSFTNTATVSSGMKPRPIVPTKLEGKAFGANEVIVFEKDLETSIEKQGDPRVWLEFVDQSGESFRVDISPAHRKAVRNTWETTLSLAKANAAANDDEAKVEVQKNYINNSAILLSYLDDVEINTPLGTRLLSENEAVQITRVLNLLAVRRFDELATMDREVQSTIVSNVTSN